MSFNKNIKKIKVRWFSLGRKICEICGKFHVKISIREAADKVEDESITRKIGNYKYKEGSDFIALLVEYCHECKIKYLNKAWNTKSNST